MFRSVAMSSAARLIDGTFGSFMSGTNGMLRADAASLTLIENNQFGQLPCIWIELTDEVLEMHSWGKFGSPTDLLKGKNEDI